MLCDVGNVSLPTPVFLAGGAMCLLAGYLVGAIASPDTPDRTTATVVSYDDTSSRLCLAGATVKDAAGADSSGELCGIWRRTPGSTLPSKGDAFRFVSVSTTGELRGKKQSSVVLYGDVAR